MAVDRFGNSQDKREERRYPAPTAPTAHATGARKGATTQIHRARVKQVSVDRWTKIMQQVNG
jgi:hypothetical protein